LILLVQAKEGGTAPSQHDNLSPMKQLKLQECTCK